MIRPASVRALSRLCAIRKFKGCTSKNSGACVKHVFLPQSCEKGLLVTGLVHPRTSIVLRTTPNGRLADVDHAVRPPVANNH